MSNLIAAWAVTYIFHSTILILAVLLASRWIRSAELRDLLWKVAVVGGIVTASFQLAVPSSIQLPLAGVPSALSSNSALSISQEPPAVSSTLPQTAMKSSTPSSVDLGSVTKAAVAQPGFQALIRRIMERLLTVLWILGAGFLLARLALGHFRLLGDLESRIPIIDGEDFHLLERLRTAAAVQAPVRLSASDKSHSPMAMLGSEIVIPRPVFARLTSTQRESILAHELAHVRRRDPEWLTFAQIVSAILFFQPLNRLAVNRFKETSEYICDDAAVRQTGNRRALAETLAELAATLSPAWWVRVAGMAEGGSPLIRRVSRVLSRNDVADEPPKVRLGVRLAVVFLPLVLIAATGPGVAASAPEADHSRAGARADSASAPALESMGGLPSSQGPEATLVARSAGATVAKSSAGEADSAAESDLEVRVTGRMSAPSSGGFQRFAEGQLTQSFEGPEGSTTVNMTARAAEVAMDGSWVRFFDDGGYINVRQESDRGPLREVSVTADRRGEPRYVYHVDGRKKEWCSDAERVLAASWLGKKAYEGWSPSSETSRGEAQTNRGVPDWSTHLEWSASTSNSTNENGVSRRLRMVAKGFHYNPETGEIYIEPDGILEVEETVDNRQREFTLTAGTVNWGGEWEGRGKDLPQQWLRRILESNSSLPSSVIETITRR